LDTGPGLDTTWADLVGGKDEATVTGISQLGSKGVLVSISICPIGRASTGLVDRGADGACGVASSIHSTKGSGESGGQAVKLCAIGGDGGTAVAVRGHHELAVRVPVNEHLGALGSTSGVEECCETLGLGSVSSGETLIGLRAWGGRGTPSLPPLDVPVSVDIAAIASASTGGSLSVLAPQTSSGLTEHEAIGVYNWEDVVIKLVDISSNCSAVGIVVEEIVREVLDSHG